MVQHDNSSQALRVADTRYGSLTIIKNDTMISRALHLYGEWAQLEVEGLAPFISQGGVAIDVGAFIGTHALAFSELVGSSGKVLSFEPHSPIFAILKENVRNSHFDNIQIHNFAIGAQSTMLRVRSLGLVDEANFGGFSLRDPIVAHDSAETIQVRTIDSMSLDRVDFIKADVEGMEIDVLHGARESVRRYRPIIFAECNSLSNTVPLFEWSQEHNYLPFGLLSRAFNPQNYAGNHENFFGEALEAGLLLLPAERTEQYADRIKTSKFPRINAVDDLALLLLHKPQYSPEVLAHTATAAVLGTYYPSPLSATRAAEIAELSQQVEERDSRLFSLTKSGSRQHEELVERDHRIAAQAQALSERETKIAQQAALIAMLVHSNSEREAEVAARDSGLAALSQCLAESESSISSLDGQVTNLKTWLAERDAVVAEREVQIVSYAETLFKQEATLVMQNSRLSRLESALAVHPSRLATTENFRILRSLGLAKPLRFIARIVEHYISIRIEPSKGELRVFPESTENFECSFASTLEQISSEFDVAYYLRRYPDVAAAGVDPISHYVEFGAAEMRDPNSSFCTKFYLDSNPDVKASGINPFLHYVRTGRYEGRTGVPLPVVAAEDPEGCAEVVEQIREHFDVAYYLRQCPELAASGVDPVEHYVERGTAELRDPSPDFCTKYYLDTNPDVKASGMNPFLHYVRTGRYEGKTAVFPGGFRARFLETLQPLEHLVASWRNTSNEPQTLSGNALDAILKTTLGNRGCNAVLSFGHDDYTKVVGGVQLCLAVEQESFEKQGTLHVNFHPVQPLPILADAAGAEELILRMHCNGCEVGCARVEDIETVLGRLAGTVDFSLVVHALHGYAPEAITRIALAARVVDATFWVHDYFSVCPSYTLLRNGISYCGAPPVDSPGCGICVHGETRKVHLQRIREMFSTIPFMVVAPSAVALEIWEAHTDLPHVGTRVHPHCIVEPYNTDLRVRNLPDDEPVRVAFLGYPLMHKGWPVFQTLVDACGGNPAFEFHHLGSDGRADSRIRLTGVEVSRENRSAMVDAVAENHIDFAVLWSLWPETFSFTAFEAIAGGAHILTFRDAGNIARVVEENSLGRVFETEQELLNFFRSGEAREYARRKPRFDRPARRLVFSQMTVDVPGNVAI